jgi:catechol 2,3-dioxygenase-like lactoylglutathione lyase family enzyme
MIRKLAAVLALSTACSAAPPALAQSGGDARVIAFRHHHLNVTSLEDHRKFWIDALGAEADTSGGTDNVRFPGFVIRMNRQPPTGGTQGSTVDHLGFHVPDLRRALEHVKTGGFRISSQDARAAFVLGPDDVKVELVEDRSLTVPIAFNHLHLTSDSINAMKEWYVKVFGARPARHGAVEAAELPYINFEWTRSSSPVVSTKGRVLDHFGFTVTNVERFGRQLAAEGVAIERPLFKVPEFGLAVIYIRDPWGTLIELTEEIDKTR